MIDKFRVAEFPGDIKHFCEVRTKTTAEIPRHRMENLADLSET